MRALKPDEVIKKQLKATKKVEYYIFNLGSRGISAVGGFWRVRQDFDGLPWTSFLLARFSNDDVQTFLLSIKNLYQGKNRKKL